MGGNAATLNRIRTHYDVLQVSRDASPEVIVAAYRALSRRHHPDRNDDPDAADAMAAINAAYAVLSDPERRRDHDEWVAAQEAWGEDEEEPRQLLGDWRGRKPPRRRSHLRRFGYGYALLGVAGASLFLLLAEPRAAPSGLPPYDRSAGQTPTSAAGAPAQPAASKEPAPPAAGAAVDPDVRSLALDLLGTDEEERARRGRDGDPALLRAPNGRPWPAQAGYVPGYEQLRADGLSNVVIDNRANENAMFLKLVAIDEDRTSPVRHLFVPPRSSFTIEKLRAGRYDVRYQNLGTGALARSQSFELLEVERPAGTEYSNVTLTLHEAPGDAADTFKLSPEEF